MSNRQRATGPTTPAVDEVDELVEVIARSQMADLFGPDAWDDRDLSDMFRDVCRTQGRRIAAAIRASSVLAEVYDEGHTEGVLDAAITHGPTVGIERLAWVVQVVQREANPYREPVEHVCDGGCRR